MKKIVMRIIRIYQQALSPYMGKQCRFHPSCSSYAAEAIETRGVFKGMILSAWRVLKCQPLHPGGFDPVE